jgi:hypothetical protein
MQRLDRLGWTDGVAFVAYGRRFGIRTNSAPLMPELVSMLPPGARRIEADHVEILYSLRAAGVAPGRRLKRRFNLAYADIERIARDADLPPVLEELESHLHLWVAAFARSRVFIHAGVVEWRGKAIVIPGPSLTGKTTLVRELLKAGASYYSDEYAVVDPRGWVHPFARPLHVRSGRHAVRGRKVAVEDLGASVGTRSVPVGMVVLTRYERGAVWRPRPLAGGRAVLSLLENTVPARVDPGRVLAHLPRMVAGARVLQGKRGPAPAAVERILRAADWSAGDDGQTR